VAKERDEHQRSNVELLHNASDCDYG